MVRKTFRFGAIKWQKEINSKTEDLIAGNQETECLWNVLSLSYKDRNLWQMALTNLSKKFNMSGKLFWK